MAPLSSLAAEVEAQLRSGMDAAALQPALQVLDVALQSFLQALAQQLATITRPSGSAATPSPEQVLSVCNTLAALLADDNLEAVELLAEHSALLELALGVHYAPLAEAVRRFNCEQALVRLRNAAQSIGLTLSNDPGTP